MILKQYPLFSQIPDSEHFLWLMREYSQEKKDTKQNPKNDDWPSHRLLLPWIKEVVETDNISNEKVNTSLDAFEITFPLNKPASSTSLTALRYLIGNRKTIEEDKQVKKIIEQLEYHNFYEKRQAILEHNDKWMKYLNQEKTKDIDDDDIETYYKRLEDCIIRDSSLQAIKPTPPEIQEIITNEVINNRFFSINGSQRIGLETYLKWFFQKNNPIELDGLSRNEVQSMAQNWQPKALMDYLEHYICDNAFRYDKSIVKRSHTLTNSFNISPELLSRCSPWHTLKTDKETKLISSIRNTHKDLKQYIQTTYSPWVFEQLKKKLPALCQSHLPVTTKVLIGISICLKHFGNNPEFNNIAKKHNSVSLSPFSQLHYPVAFQLREGLC